MTKGERMGAIAAYVTLAIVWGTTYNAIRICVEVFNPFFYSAVRFVIAGGLMLGVARMLGVPFPRGLREILPIVISGFFLLVVGNGLLSVAEMTVQSGVASVISPMAPIFIALMVYAFPGEERLDRLGWIGVLLGFAGIVMLFWDKITADGFGVATGELLLIGCCLSWSFGSVVQRRFTTARKPMVIAGLQMLTGGIGQALCFPFYGPALHAPVTAEAIFALSYLILIGGCLAFFCWAYLVTKMPVARAATYGYFNPLVALLLGALLLGEVFKANQLVGMGLAVAGVMIVHLGKRGSRAGTEPTGPRHAGYADRNRTPSEAPGGTPSTRYRA